ncbi:MAG: SufD family Fe-S cluster assembly protein [Candidatus Diapherotrites archaeon]|uniref:SufD family Fe-S cluster assembly protein n=1 Tax=Candidatus Iainarchaeum sp. TaxID=3101447 RepID=A0A8T3YN11_9ARCH|nr:SufD family Fe-S cluster assembly protein [Candidatus Diapherotrites archaeon]
MRKSAAAQAQEHRIAKEPEWMAAYRESNLAVFTEKPLRKSKYTSITRLEEIIAGNSGAVQPAPKIVHGKPTVLSIAEALYEIPELLRSILAAEEKPKDQFEGYINSHFNSGFVIVAGKEAGDITLRIEAPEGVCSKRFIIIEEGAECCIIEELAGHGTTLCSETVYLGKGAKATIARLHLGKGDSMAYQQCIAEEGASLVNSNAWLSGNLVRGNTANILNGPGASAMEYSALIGSGSQHFDINYSSIHRTQATDSHCIFKSAMKDSSSSVFDGMIRIQEGADKSNALLECHSIILGGEASSNQIPGLEIKTDDVKATHSATVSRIEEEELFYIQSRGIIREDAEKMVLRSFLESAVSMLPQKARERLVQEIELRT